MSQTSLSIRPAILQDVPTIFRLIKDLAEYEKLSHEVVGTEAALAQHLFGPDAFVEVLLAEVAEVNRIGKINEVDGSTTPLSQPDSLLKMAVGFALFFKTYSTYRTCPGFYLEDLFVQPEYRRRGIGKGLFIQLAKRAVKKGYTHLNWSVLDWNEMAIAFYKGIGANINNERRVCRITGDNLATLAQAFQHHQDSDIAIAPVTDTSVLPLFQQIQSSAAFHGAPDHVIGSIANLRQHLFDSPPAIEAMIADQNGTAGIATFSYTYSTFLTQPGLYLEDLFVATDKRRQGIGTRLLSQMSKVAIDRNCGRLEWLVQNWNKDAIAFYKQHGADILPDWRRCQLADKALYALANLEPKSRI